MKKQIGNITVTANEWRKGDQHRIYFDAGRDGKACWDVEAGEWIKQHGEFGYRFKAMVKEAFGL